MTKGSDLLVAALENEGVTRIFGVPGEENLDVVESLRTSKIDLVVTRHEQTAAFLAATYGRLTGKPGVCIATLGPGALNLVTGAAQFRGGDRDRQQHARRGHLLGLDLGQLLLRELHRHQFGGLHHHRPRGLHGHHQQQCAHRRHAALLHGGGLNASPRPWFERKLHHVENGKCRARA